MVQKIFLSQRISYFRSGCVMCLMLLVQLDLYSRKVSFVPLSLNQTETKAEVGRRQNGQMEKRIHTDNKDRLQTRFRYIANLLIL